MNTYRNKNVTVVRDAKVGDMNYKTDGTDQVLVRYDDGTTSAVLRSEVKGDAVKVDPKAPVVEVPKKEVQDVQTFLQELSQKLKNAQTNTSPTTLSQVVDSIDEYIRNIGNGKVTLTKVK